MRPCAEGELKGIISDLDGVAYRGDSAIPDAVEAFRRWRAAGIPYAFVTNNATRSAADFAAKLMRMGIITEPEHVFCAVSATASLLRRRWPGATTVFAIGEQPLFEALGEAGFTQAGENAEIVVLGFDRALTYDKLRTAVRAALGGAPVVVTNPDMLVPVEEGFEPCVGVLMAAVQAAVPDCRSIVVGKPEPAMIEEALGFLGTPRDGTIMIGDQVNTDIAAGKRAGLRSILVKTGVAASATAVFQPDRTVASLLELF